MDLGGRDQQLMVDQAVAKEMDRSAEHHLKAAALHDVDVIGKVAALHGPIVDDGKVHEAVVGQQEEVAEGIDERFGLLAMLQFIEINDHAEHKHRGDDWPDVIGDDGMAIPGA